MSELLIYGEIGWDCVASDVVRELQSLEGDVVVRVNSGGGDVYDGLAIMNALAAHDGSVTAVVEGLAASAASFIVVGGADRVVMRSTAELMIHDAMSFVGGNAEEMLSAITDLERISDNLSAIYAQKAGGEPGDWRALMKAETWYSADEAVSAGLADAVEDGRAVEARAGRRVVMAKFRYQGRRAAPAPTVNRPAGHERKEHAVSALADLAREMGLDEQKLSDSLRRVLNEEITVSSSVDISYPEDATVVPTGRVTVEPVGEIPPGLVFTVGEAPDGWNVEVDEATGVLTITAPAGAEPDNEVTLMVTATGDEPVELPVTITVKSAAEDDEAESSSSEPSDDPISPEQIALDVDTYRDLRAAAKLGWEAKANAEKAERTAEVEQWITDGRINAALRSKVMDLMDTDADSARRLYGSNPKNTVPVAEIGHGLSAEEPDGVPSMESLRALSESRKKSGK